MSRTTTPSKVEVVLRRAEAKDIEAIIAIGGGVFAATFGHSMPPADLDNYLQTTYNHSSIASEVASPDVDTIVAVDVPLGQVVGFCQLTRGTTDPCLAGMEKTIELQRLYISERYHGAGVGRKLAARVEEMAREQGFGTMWLGVWEENFKAQKVYERFGYGKIGSHEFVVGEYV